MKDGGRLWIGGREGVGSGCGGCADARAGGVSGIGFLEQATHLFGGDRELLGDSADAAAEIFPYAEDDEFGELFLNLLEAFLTELAFGPATEGVVDTGGAEDFELEIGEFLEEVVAIILAEEQGSFRGAAAGDVEIGAGLIEGGEATGEKGFGDQAAILGGFSEFDGAIGELYSALQVGLDVVFAVDLLFGLGSFDGALQAGGACHEDDVGSLGAELVGTESFDGCSLHVAALEVEEAGVYEDRAGAALMMMHGVDLAGAGEEAEAFVGELEVADIQRAGCVLAVEGGSEFESEEAFDVGGIDHGAGEVGVVAKAVLVDGNGFFEVGEGVRIVAGAANETAAGGLDVTEGEGVADGLEFEFGFVKEFERAGGFSVLEDEPALVDLSDGDELGALERLGAVACGENVERGVGVVALLALSSSLPEICEEDEEWRKDVGSGEGAFEVDEGLLEVFGGEAVEGGEKLEANDVDEWKIGRSSGKLRQYVFQEVEIAIAKIDPLGQGQGERDGVAVVGCEVVEDIGCAIEETKAFLDVPGEEALLEMGLKVER
jgi:hypothetical protein